MMERAVEMGLFKQLPLHSRTSQYGQLSRYKEFDPSVIKKFIAEQYDKIESGQFSDEWAKEQENGCKKLDNMRDEAFANELSVAEVDLHNKLSQH